MAIQNPQLQNLRKAAFVLLSLPHRQRSALLDRLDRQQADAAIAAMNAVGRPGGDEQEAAVREFTAVGRMPLARPRSEPSAAFQFLYDLDADDLLALMADEQPQTLAAVLSHVPPPLAAAALAGLPPDERLAVVRRIAAGGEADPAVVRDLADGLKRRLDGAAGHAPAKHGLTNAVRILNAMPPAAERQLLGDLAAAAPQLVHEIRRTMFGADVAACQELETSLPAG